MSKIMVSFSFDLLPRPLFLSSIANYEHVTCVVAVRKDLFITVWVHHKLNCWYVLKEKKEKKNTSMSNSLPKLVWNLDWIFKAMVCPSQPTICILSGHVWSERRSKSINSTFASRQAYVKIPYRKGCLNCCRSGKFDATPSWPLTASRMDS